MPRMTGGCNSRVRCAPRCAPSRQILNLFHREGVEPCVALPQQPQRARCLSNALADFGYDCRLCRSCHLVEWPLPHHVLVGVAVSSPSSASLIGSCLVLIPDSMNRKPVLPSDTCFAQI
jgi:hypothetical protein